MKVLDLFAGIAGFSLGLERAGMETVAFCEIDKHCQAVLRKHWPQVPIFEDITKLKASDMPCEIDLICGGFPCQDISVAGQKRGFKDEAGRTRSGLWEEYKRLIKEIKPRYAIIENVANLRNLGLNQVIKDLWSIGYDCEWHIISARSIGACHLRERIWIIAYAYGSKVRKQSKCELWSESEALSGELGQARETPDPQRLGQSGSRESRSSECAKKGRERETGRADHADANALNVPNPNMPRLWQSFASEEEKSEWWAKATACVGDWYEAKSFVRGVFNGLSEWMESSRGTLDGETAKSLLEDLSNLPPKVYEKEIRPAIRRFKSISYEKDLFAILWKLQRESDSLCAFKEGEAFEERFLRELQRMQEFTNASYQRELERQFGAEFKNFMCQLPHETPLGKVEELKAGLELERSRRERIKQLGNAVVPFIPELIGRAIMEYEHDLLHS